MGVTLGVMRGHFGFVIFDFCFLLKHHTESLVVCLFLLFGCVETPHRITCFCLFVLFGCVETPHRINCFVVCFCYLSLLKHHKASLVFVGLFTTTTKPEMVVKRCGCG